METRLSILFYGKKSLQNADKLLAIYLRVTLNGQCFEVSVQRYVEPGKWSASGGKMKGNSQEARSLNQYLDSLRQRVYEYQKTVMQEGKMFTKESLRNKWYGIDERTHTLVEVFTNHNQQLEALIGISNSKATYGKSYNFRSYHFFFKLEIWKIRY
jgi:hypothetical protein